MQIGSSGKLAKAFINGAWTGWLPVAEAKRMESEALYGTNPKGIFLKAEAQHLGKMHGNKLVKK
jgi:hypothetical protein